MKTHAKFEILVPESLVLHVIAYPNSMFMKADANLYRLAQDSLVLIAFADIESLKRRDVDEDTGQILQTSSRQFSTNRNCEQPVPKKKGCR